MTDPSRVRTSGALQPFATGFAAELARQGYRSGSQAQQLRLMAHVSRWLGSNDMWARPWRGTGSTSSSNAA